MAVRDIFKVNRKTFFNPTAWIDINSIMAGNRAIRDSTAGIFTIPTARHKETFDEAMKRLNVSEASVKRSERNFLYFAILFFVLGGVLLGFTFYLLFVHRSFLGFLIGVPVAGLCFGQAFRFHFWHFQIKHRKLGCTFEEWLQGKPHTPGHKS